ncbi:MAG: sirohydrochlorin chelatase [Okeania sp. SIO2H7]|nr:sirohydrochlorin chelatase [Okeania sp. SIO2H7]
MPSAYFLVSHGSSDPRPQESLVKLAELLSDRLYPLTSNSNSGKQRVLVGCGTLELAPTPLHQQLLEFGRSLPTPPISEIQVIPLFLLPGVHVAEDIPAEIAMASKTLGDRPIALNLQPYLGSHPGIRDLLAAKMKSYPASSWVLVSHGSRRPGGNLPVEEIANYLEHKYRTPVCTGYWSVGPSWDLQILNLVRDGHKKIGIVPYFLFKGGITEAIARSVEQFVREYPAVNFYLAEPLGATIELVELIVETVSTGRWSGCRRRKIAAGNSEGGPCV